jgi:hypothetical protein
MLVEKFGREMARIDATALQQGQAIAVTREIDNLAANMLTGVPSPTLVKLLSKRGAEKAHSRGSDRYAKRHHPADPALLTLFQEKVEKL